MVFYLFLKCGHAILVTIDAKFLKPSVLIRLLHNEYENVICAKKSFTKKGTKHFLVKNKIGASRTKMIFGFIFNFNIFHVFLVKVLNIISINQIEICTFFTRKNSKLNYIHLKPFFDGLVQSLQFFLVK